MTTRDAEMRLEVVTPTDTLVDVAASKVIAEAENGLFCLLPRHADFVASLVPSILYYTDVDGAEGLLAIDEGVLVKCAGEVRVSTLNAVEGADVESLRARLAEMSESRDQRERRARAALARVEAATIRRMVELERVRRG